MRDIAECSGRTCRGRCLDMKIFGRFSSSSALVDCISNQRRFRTFRRIALFFGKIQAPDPMSRDARRYLGAMTVV